MGAPESDSSQLLACRKSQMRQLRQSALDKKCFAHRRYALMIGAGDSPQAIPVRGGINPVRLISVPLGAAVLFVLAALTASVGSFAALRPSNIPDWLQRHVGDNEGQISQVVLERARALHQKKVSEGSVSNPCYFAMDATRPATWATVCLANATISSARPSSSFERFLRAMAAAAISKALPISPMAGVARKTSATRWIRS